MNYLFLNTNVALKLQGRCWEDDMVMFTAHLSVTIKHLTRYKQKVLLVAILEGKGMLCWKIKVPQIISLKCVSSHILV